MERKVAVTDLVGAAEIAERLGWSHAQTVHTIRRRHADFPEPVAKLRTAMVWAWPDVEAWARKTGRLQWRVEHYEFDTRGGMSLVDQWLYDIRDDAVREARRLKVDRRHGVIVFNGLRGGFDLPFPVAGQLIVQPPRAT